MASAVFFGTVELPSRDGAVVLNVGASRTASAGFREWWDGGAEYLRRNAREIWAGVKSLDCGRIVDAASSFDPLTIIFDRVARPVATCQREFRKGFICNIPDSIKDIATLAWGSLSAAWEHRWRCGAAGLLTGPLAPGVVSMCGFYYFAEPKVRKMATCMRKLYRERQFFSMLWVELGKIACSVAGQITLDVLLEFLSGGTGTAAIVAKWIKRIGDALSPAQRLKIAGAAGQRTFDAAVDFSKNVMRNLSECR